MNSKNFLILALCSTLLACSQGDIEIHEQSNMSKKDFEGSWIVLNYWADWCPPCIKEIPELYISELGKNKFTKHIFIKSNRNIYKLTLPSQTKDFEYYIKDIYK